MASLQAQVVVTRTRYISTTLPLPNPPALIKACLSSSSLRLTNPLTSHHLSTSSATTNNKPLGFHRHLRCSIDYNDHNDYYHHNRVVYPRPSEIQWKKELSNSVHLIGNVGAPVQIKHLNSGKVLAWTRLGVKKSASDTVWINLTFWDELAHIAYQHVEKGHRIYVSGRLVSDTVRGDEEKMQTYYKVVVQQLNFVENSFSQLPVNEHGKDSIETVGKIGNDGGTDASSTEQLWQAFFANPVDWWDNRRNKRNPRYPDFKHKHTGEALWIEAKYNPPWVKSQLAILDSRMESLHAYETNMPVSFMSGDDLMPF
uniref:Protein OSB2, chloroplastic-like n=1 Tax=Nelumbo nucifera TaxID=4432 RepID=A0A822XH67_NELNU|nr:TPA_asm: hypothetical protein HUJ06_021193 [Nelumbo nucifera]